jgi:hypothetical protein
MEMLRAAPVAEGAQDSEKCSVDTDSVPSCFLYDAEALTDGAMMNGDVFVLSCLPA